ncbi:MAG: polysaccharide deacetylase family protein [Salinivirgaceae bacterium]
MLTVYTHKKTNRLLYTLDFVLKDYLGIAYTVTTDAETYKNELGPKLNYSMENFKDHCVRIFPVLLLFQEDVTEHQIQVGEWNDVKIFYKVSKGDLPFDIFAATFFMISRYEEYLYAKRDRFGRYDPRNSLAWKNAFLYDPVVNIWLNRLRELILERYPRLELRKSQYTYRPTIDIDSAWAYLHKGLFRTGGGMLMNMIKHRFTDFGTRAKVLMGMERDPFDTYDEMDRIHKKYNLKPIVFFLLGNYGGNDKSISPGNKHFQALINRYHKSAEVGIHASFASFDSTFHLKDEIEYMADIIEDQVMSNRYHFIKFTMPKSYEKLINKGLTHDYSMGYASRMGFRSGFAGQYNFFNLKQNQSTNLRIHPFQIMDATLNFYSKLTPSEAFEQATEIIDKVKAVGGELNTVWHNESLSGISPWRGWDVLYEKVVEYASK